jgi:dTMP kinase
VTNGKRLICVTGIDGSGKTTLLARLAERLPNCRLVTIWDYLYEPEASDPVPFAGKAGADGYLESLGHPARAEFLLKYMRKAVERALRSRAETLLIDAYWYKYFASELAMHGDAILPDLAAIVADFPKPDLVFFIDFDAPSALLRKKSYSGYESGYDPERRPEGFIAFQSKAFANLKRLAAANDAIVLDGASPVETKVDQCLAAVARITSGGSSN